MLMVLDDRELVAIGVEEDRHEAPQRCRSVFVLGMTQSSTDHHIEAKHCISLFTRFSEMRFGNSLRTDIGVHSYVHYRTARD